MKVVYVGKKPKATIHFPIGCKSRQEIVARKDFFPGKPVLMSDEDGKKLIEIDPANQFKEFEAEPFVEKKRGRPPIEKEV